jgi:hypothetical protein
VAHYDVLVILNPPIPNLLEKVAERMHPFDANWEDRKQPWRWDWYSMPEDGPFADPDALRLVNGIDVPSRACRISRLPFDYSVAAAITPDGTWHDIQDFGWRLMDEGSPRNKEAAAKWHAHFRDIVSQYQDAIGVEVHCHG